jgi:hypothetical protein
MDEFQRVGVSRAIGKALRLCTKCSVEIIAARPPTYVSERCVRGSWSCELCGFECDTTAAVIPMTRVQTETNSADILRKPTRSEATQTAAF